MELSTPAPGSSHTIELATWHDLSALRRIEKACFPKDAWPLLDLIGILTFPNIIRLKAICDGQMVGFVAGDIKRSERLAWIATIGVLPEYRLSGVDAMLMATTADAAMKKGYTLGEASWILENNVPMRQGLENTGWKVYKTYRIFEKAL